MAVYPGRSSRLFRACNTAHSKCRTLLKPIMAEVRALSETGLGQYDACGLSKPIYSVAALIARSPKLGTKDDFLVCLKVLQQTRWVYSDHEKRVADLRFLWNVSRDESLDEPPELPGRVKPEGATTYLPPPGNLDFISPYPLPAYNPSDSPPLPSPPSPPFSPIFRSSSPARSRGSSGGSFCTPEGHNSPDDDVPSRKSPSRLASILSKWEKKRSGS